MGVGGGKTTLGHSGTLHGGHGPSPPSSQTKETSFWSREELQPVKVQLVHFTGANVLVMALQGYKSPHQKSRPLESDHSSHGV